MTVYLGQGCDQSSYRGWFFELAGNIGPVWAGVDLGMGTGPGDIPRDYSGTFEGGGGLSMSAKKMLMKLGGKVAMCWYTWQYETLTEKCCD
ncbi:MAG: hypothetical protein HQ518_16465 [Rhodopirellula sp.]|nr:hypothetical protein [Rhodopirellula sp.]